MRLGDTGPSRNKLQPQLKEKTVLADGGRYGGAEWNRAAAQNMHPLVTANTASCMPTAICNMKRINLLLEAVMQLDPFGKPGIEL